MATQAGKARQTRRGGDVESAPKAKVVSRPKAAPASEVVDKVTRGRFEQELDGAIKRKPTPSTEAKLAGALRAVAVLSPGVRTAVAEATEVLVRRGSYAREIYGASIRALAESDDKRTTALLKNALGGDEAGGSATLSAACFCKDPTLAPQLAKIAASRQSHLAFGAETARVARAESNGAHLVQLAPMIKESHRISLCSELFVPLARGAPIPVHVSPALAVLRGAERHLGRWLVLADVAAKAGDRGPFEEATLKASSGPASARAAWSLVAWALAETSALAKGEAPPPPPETRPTVELVARLSDRPSADRDTTFLFRMARARAPVCRAMLEALVKTAPLVDEIAIRAALYLARDHGREDMLDALSDAASSASGSGGGGGGNGNGNGVAPKREELRGLAVAALWDAGAREKARELADELVTSRVIGNVAWSALVRAAAARGQTSGVHEPVLGETPLRWIQWGWLE
jgi:hypothetical protein